MSHVIAYPDDLFQKIATYAAKQGKTPEEVLIALAEQVTIEEVVVDEQNVVSDDDPFFQLAGILHSGTPDLGVNHDAYLAEAYADTHEKD